MGTIAQEITRIQTAKSDIKTAIESKGVTVPSNALISDYDDYVNAIQQGSGGSFSTANFNSANYLFMGGRLQDVYDKLLPYFTGNTLNSLMYGAGVGTGSILAKASVGCAFVQKGLQNISNQTGYSTKNLYLTNVFNPCSFDDSDKDININNSNMTSAGTASVKPIYISIDGMLGSPSISNYVYAGNVTIDFLQSTDSEHYIIHNNFGRVRCTGNIKLYYHFDQRTHEPFGSYNILNGGTLYEFCLIPPSTTGSTLNLSYLVDTMSEDTLTRSFALYSTSPYWTANHTMTIKLPSLLYSNLQQTTIDTATSLGITLTS